MTASWVYLRGHGPGGHYVGRYADETLQDEQLICECELIGRGRLEQTMRDTGTANLDDIRRHLRLGMGPCQGRLCGLTVTEMIAAARGVAPSEVGYYRLRPPVKPVTLAELAALPKTDAATRAVVR